MNRLWHRLTERLKHLVSRRRAIIGGSLLAGIFFLSGALYGTLLPKLRSWVLVKIEAVSRDSLPVRVLPGSIDVSLVPLGLSLTDVQIAPKPEIAEFLHSASFDSIHVAISPWQILRGRLHLTELSVAGVKIDAHVPKGKQKSGPPLEGLFDAIKKMPVNEIEIDGLSGRVSFAEPDAALDLDDVQLTVAKGLLGSLSIDLGSGSVQAHMPAAEPQAALKIDVETAARLSPKEIHLERLKVRRGDSVIEASGWLKGDVEALDVRDAELEASSDLDLQSMRNWSVKTFTKQLAKVPPMKGRAAFNARIKRSGGKTPEVEFEALTQDLQIAKIQVGRIRTAGSYSKDELRIPKLTLDHPAGTALLTDVALSLGETKTVAGKLKIESVELHELLKTIDVGDLPVFLKVAGETPCSGTLQPELNVTCKGQIHGENARVAGSMTDRGSIAAFKQFDARGEFTVDKQKVVYNAELAMPNSTGRSRGVVEFANGFKISYEADKLAIKDVSSIADLKLEGTARLKGTTEGDSHAATIAMELDTQDVWLEDFWLGNVKGGFGYKAGTLSFSNLQGYYTVSRYNADVKLDLHPSANISVNGRMPFFDARDVLKVFSRRVKLPFAVTGTGQATIKTSGPLALNKMSYDLKTSLFRGSVASETFDQAYFDVKSVDGEVKAERVQVTKGTGTMKLTGAGHPDGTIQTAIQGRDFKLEDSVLVSASGLALSGVVDFDMKLSGPVLAPDTTLQGKLSKTSIGEQGVPDSTFRLKLGSKKIEGDGVLLGDVMRTEFTLPLDESSPFALKLDTHDWNFAPVFASIAGPGSRRDYEGHLTSTIELASPSGGFWNSSGTMAVDSFALTRGPLALRSSGPLKLSMKRGQVHVEKFELGGENMFLKITDSPHPVSNVDLQVNGKLDLTLLALLTPFFEDLRGILSFAFNFRADQHTADILGSAYAEKGYLKFFDFPHPLEDIRIDLLFNQKKILFNSMKAEFGGGRIAASGGMELKGYKNYPVNVSGTFDKVSLNVPDKIKTTGSGTISFSGNWFPFTLKANYEVKDGLVTKEFGGESGDAGSIRRDQFLPELLLAERFVPILLDLDIDFTKGLAIKNELLEGKAIGQLQVKGNPAKPSMLGSIQLDKESKIFFRDTAFEVTTANVQMTDPNEVNPKLYIAARSRVQDYDISLLVTGSGQKPEVNLTSVPPLAQNDIISLLALGATDSQLNSKIKSGEQSAQTGIQVGTSALKNNPLSKEIKNRFGFDVQFEAGFDEATSVQKILISRQFTQRFGVSASQLIGKSRGTDAEMRYRFSDRFSGVLSWQNREETESSDKNRLLDRDPNKLGLDLEYKFEFK